MLNKKSFIFLPTLAIITILLLSFAFFMRETNPDKPNTKYVGEIQGKVLEIYQQAEKDLFYVSYSVKNSVLNTIDFFGKSAGSKNLETRFKALTKEYMNQRGIIRDYNLFFEENYVVGIAQEKTILEKDTIKYKYNSSFKQYISSNFNDYNILIRKIDNLLTCLEDKGSTSDIHIKACEFTEDYKRKDNVLVFKILSTQISVSLFGEKEGAKEFGESV